MRKKPSANYNPKLQKKPRTIPDEPQYFRWRTEHVDKSAEEWGWGSMSCCDFFTKVASALHHMEGSTWAQMKGSGQAHFYPPQSIVRKAQERLDKLVADGTVPDDWAQSELVSLKRGNKPRIWGFQQARILYLLWWDPNHSVYPVDKKS